MSEWESVRAGLVFDIQMGRQRSPDRANGPDMADYLRSANVADGSLSLRDVKQMDFNEAERERFRLLKDDVLVTEGSASASAVGMAAVWNEEIPGDVCFQNTLLRYRAVPGLTIPGFVAQWCFWAFRSGAFNEVASGTNIRHIGATRAAAMQVSLPSLAEQQRVVDVMATVDSQVEALQGCLDDIASVLSTARKQVFSRPTPRKTFSHVAVLQRGYDLPVQERQAGSVPVVASNGPVGFHSAAAVQGPGVVTGRSGTIGKVMLYEEHFWPLNTTLFVKDFRGNQPQFVKHLLASMDLRSHAGGSTVPSLNRNVLDQIDVYCPSVTEQCRVASALDAIEQTQTELRREAQMLRVFRADLLSALLSQRFEIPESYDTVLAAIPLEVLA